MAINYYESWQYEAVIVNADDDREHRILIATDSLKRALDIAEEYCQDNGFLCNGVLGLHNSLFVEIANNVETESQFNTKLHEYRSQIPARIYNNLMRHADFNTWGDFLNWLKDPLGPRSKYIALVGKVTIKWLQDYFLDATDKDNL